MGPKADLAICLIFYLSAAFEIEVSQSFDLLDAVKRPIDITVPKQPDMIFVPKGHDLQLPSSPKDINVDLSSAKPRPQPPKPGKLPKGEVTSWLLDIGSNSLVSQTAVVNNDTVMVITEVPKSLEDNLTASTSLITSSGDFVIKLKVPKSFCIVSSMNVLLGDMKETINQNNGSQIEIPTNEMTLNATVEKISKTEEQVLYNAVPAIKGLCRGKPLVHAALVPGDNDNDDESNVKTTVALSEVVNVILPSPSDQERGKPSGGKGKKPSGDKKKPSKGKGKVNSNDTKKPSRGKGKGNGKGKGKNESPNKTSDNSNSGDIVVDISSIKTDISIGVGAAGAKGIPLPVEGAAAQSQNVEKKDKNTNKKKKKNKDKSSDASNADSSKDTDQDKSAGGNADNGNNNKDKKKKPSKNNGKGSLTSKKDKNSGAKVVTSKNKKKKPSKNKGKGDNDNKGSVSDVSGQAPSNGPDVVKPPKKPDSSKQDSSKNKKNENKNKKDKNNTLSSDKNDNSNSVAAQGKPDKDVTDAAKQSKGKGNKPSKSKGSKLSKSKGKKIKSPSNTPQQGPIVGPVHASQGSANSKGNNPSRGDPALGGGLNISQGNAPAQNSNTVSD